ncbi:hypothetical protein [Streptomyces luteolus]|uniref:Uncharacterized protein n=1 Tax=Streptomyces luteolus TaxID=3043615 RepID=A0ABT6SYG4_9ACTN|nr:hypothetical protein [Streptomyces sp. B-S-A12]MDI3419889.1 hypothetical protein [Streptomyces sp. B-S-A12]
MPRYRAALAGIALAALATLGALTPAAAQPIAEDQIPQQPVVIEQPVPDASTKDLGWG